MNKKKYKGCLYATRQVSDLRELVNDSVTLYAEKAAYYIKDVPGGDYRPVTFKKMKEDIDSLGTEFIDMGLKGKKIALIGENSYEWVVTYCAVANGTGVIVPLDRELPLGEISNLLVRSGVVAVVYSDRMEDVVKEAAAGAGSLEKVINMAELPALIKKGENLISNGDVRFINAEIDRDALCSLLFTSGTMGLAKGVMLSHRNLAANVSNVAAHVKIDEGKIGLSVLPMHHTYEMTCHIFMGMYLGVGIAVCEGLKYITKNMAEVRAYVMLGVPLLFESMHRKIFKQAEAAGSGGKLRKTIEVSKKFKLYNCPWLVKRMFKSVHEATGGRIGLFISGGAAINPAVIEDFEAMGFPMIQGYGITESSPLIAVNTDRFSKAASVGFPIPGTEVRISEPDETGMGEIICKGPSVMLGYYDDPEETAKVLVDGWLYTGDYGYIDNDGMIYISGRKKNVIVTKNGKNIFPEEVEFYLTQSPYIIEALVHGVLDDKSGDIVVKADIFPDYEQIAEEMPALDESGLLDFIKKEIDKVNEHMPLYKRVRRFGVRKTEFAKTTTRKIKRHTAENYSDSAIREGEEC